MAEKKKRAAGQSAGRLQGQREAGRAGARQGDAAYHRTEEVYHGDL